MTTVHFKSSVRYGNPKPFPKKDYPSFSVPAGVDARMPAIVSAQKLFELSPQKTLGGVVAGLTTTQFRLGFKDLKTQWTQTRTKAPRPLWIFQGGDLILEIEVTVYVAKGFETQKEAFATIMEHELLHVADEIRIVEKDLPKAMPGDLYVEKHLVQSNAVDDRMFESWYQGGRFESWIRDGLWTPLHNAAAQARDSGREWQAYRDKIDALQRQ
ncbi:MAG: hypothetical protein RL885_07465 [Planctomycetota bacterium]